MSPVAKVVAYAILFFWSLFVIFPLYWVIITAFKNGQIVNEGPYYIPFVDFQPTLDGWRAQFATDPILRPSVGGSPDCALWLQRCCFCAVTDRDDRADGTADLQSVAGFHQLHRHQHLRHSTLHDHRQHGGLCLARIQYKPKFGNIMLFVLLSLLVIVASYFIHWMVASAVALALFFLLVRAFGKHFTNRLGNGDILFWIISQRILPPIVVIIPIYMMFQAVGLLDTHLALIIAYAVANLPIVVWLMHDFFAGLPIELEESAQLDGATRFGIFWDIVLPLTRPGFAATTLLVLILNWNEYLLAVFLALAKSQTMPFMVAAKNAGERGILWWEMCAVIVVMIIPVIIMAILLQRFIAKGVLLGAVKG